MNFELEKARRNAIPSGQKIERYWVDERVGNPEFYTKEYTYVENGRKYGFQELKTTGYGNQWRILRKLTLKEAKGLGYYKEVKMSKFYIKEIDNYIKMTTEERRLWETRQVIQDYTYLSYDGWRNESGVLLAKLVEKLNNEKPVKIFCDKKIAESLFNNKRVFHGYKVISNSVVVDALKSLLKYHCDYPILIISSETGIIFGLFRL